MSKKKQTIKKMKKQHIAVVNDKSLAFFEKYINNPSPTGLSGKAANVAGLY